MKFNKIFVLIITAIACSPALASVGITLLSSGEVKAGNSETDNRELARRSPIFEEDYIRTGPNARAQFRMKDGALFALSENSEWFVEGYKYNQNDEDVVTLKLLKGGLRTISGAVGKKDNSRYQLETPVGSIGIRGTHYEIQLLDNGTVALGAYEGTIVLTTPETTIELGQDAAHAFAAMDKKGAITLLTSPPAALSSSSGSDADSDSASASTLLGGDTSGSSSDGEAVEAIQGNQDFFVELQEQDKELQMEELDDDLPGLEVTDPIDEIPEAIKSELILDFNDFVN